MIPANDVPSVSIFQLPPTQPSDSKGKGKGKATLVDAAGDQLYYRTYRNEEQDMEGMMRLVEQDLSEP